MIKSAFWMVIALILCCFMCACISDNNLSNTTPDTTIPVIDKTPRDEPEKISFSRALAEFELYSTIKNTTIEDETIYHIHGTTLDQHGNASSWIIGVQHENATHLYVYDQNGWRQERWGEQFLSSAIVLNSTLFPEKLYEKNQAILISAMEKQNVTESDIDLYDGVYTVTIRSVSGSILFRFNSTTGELISPLG